MSTAGSHALAGGERRVARAACREARAQREHAQRSLLPGGQQSRGGSKQGRVTVAQWVLAPHTRRRAQLWPSGSGGEHAGREGGRDTQCPSSDVLEAGAGGVLDLVWRDQSDCDLFVHVSSVPMVSLQCVRRGIHNDYKDLVCTFQNSFLAAAVTSRSHENSTTRIRNDGTFCML